MDHVDLETEKAVRRFIALIQPRYDMAGAIVYGSRARGTHRHDSDADVAILLNGEHQRALPTTLAMADIAYDVLRHRLILSYEAEAEQKTSEDLISAVRLCGRNLAANGCDEKSSK